MGASTMSSGVPGQKKVQPTRLYVKGVMMGFKRGLRNQYEHTSLLKIQNVQSKEDVAFTLESVYALSTRRRKKSGDRSPAPSGAVLPVPMAAAARCGPSSTKTYRPRQWGRKFVSCSTPRACNRTRGVHHCLWLTR